MGRASVFFFLIDYMSTKVGVFTMGAEDKTNAGPNPGQTVWFCKGWRSKALFKTQRTAHKPLWNRAWAEIVRHEEQKWNEGEKRCFMHQRSPL